MPVASVRGTLLGLDARWLGHRGLIVSLLLVMVSPAGPLSPDTTLSLWVKCGIGLSSVLLMLLTSLSHELGHALAGGLAGLPVRAVVLGPGGGVTIRGASEHAHINALTALAGPLANLVLGIACGWVATQVAGDALAFGLLLQVAVLQLITSAANLPPFGQFDGSRIFAMRRGVPSHQ